MFSATAPAGCATHGAAPQLYRRRRPERTVLYLLVQQHLETWLARNRESDLDGMPVAAHIERELRGFLTCGILAHGFARARCAGCGHDFLIAFSCKGRGICPSCTTRRMAEIGAHLVDHVFPKVPVRQWVITFPKRLRYFLHRDPALLNRVLRIVLRAIESQLRRVCPGASREARFGAVSFPQRFGAALNAHTHLHCCITDGVFSQSAGALRFHPATLSDEDFRAVQRSIRTRVLRAAVRHGAVTPEAAEDLSHWAHGGGFSLHAEVLIEAEDRRGLERLLRYCARPALASERLVEQGDECIRYTLPKPTADGRTTLTLTPLELLDRLAALIPPPRRHRHHYHGVFASHALLRALVTARAGQGLVHSAHVNPTATGAEAGRPRVALPAVSRSQSPDAQPQSPARQRAAYAGVRLLARIYECLPLACPRCGAEMQLIALITAPHAIHAILVHLGEPTAPPPLAPRARAPSEFDDADANAVMILPFDQLAPWGAISVPLAP